MKLRFAFICLILLMTCRVFSQNGTRQTSSVISDPIGRCSDNAADLIKVYPSVWDERSKRYVKDLEPAKFQIFDEQEPKPIGCFTGPDQPMIVGMLLDVSGSMQSSRSTKDNAIGPAFVGALEFVESGNSADKYFIYGFAEKAALIVDTTSDKVRISSALAEAKTLKPRGNTDLFGVIKLAQTKLSVTSDVKKVILVVSDGMDTVSNYGGAIEIRKQLQKDGILLYFIKLPPINGLEQTDIWLHSGFDTLTKATGGRVLEPAKSEMIVTAFKMIAEELRSQYTIGFVPTRAGKTKWRKLRVTVNSAAGTEKLLVQHNSGYMF